MESIFVIIAAACGAIMLESLCLCIAAWFLKPRGTRQITLLPVLGDCPDFEARLRWQLFRADSVYFKGGLLLVVDCGASPVLRETAERLCRGKRSCRLCRREELAGILGDKSVCKEVELVLY